MALESISAHVRKERLGCGGVCSWVRHDKYLTYNDSFVDACILLNFFFKLDFKPGGALARRGVWSFLGEASLPASSPIQGAPPV